MTQLDRLEALLKQDRWNFDQMEEVEFALPDLIRVARAAKELSDFGSGPWLTAPAPLEQRMTYVIGGDQMKAVDEALIPLFAEVES